MRGVVLPESAVEARPLDDDEHGERHGEQQSGKRRPYRERVARKPVAHRAGDDIDRLVADGARRGDGVELVRVVQHGGLRRPRGPPVVMTSDRVQKLRADVSVERCGTLLDQAQPEVDVPQQAAFVGRTECRPARQLARAPDVVEESSGEQQVTAEAWMKLASLSAEGRDADGVLQQAAGVPVVPVRRGRQLTKRAAQLTVVEEAGNRRAQTGVSDLACQELEETVKLVRVSPERRRERGRIGVGDGLQRSNVELQPVAEALDAAEHAHDVAFAEACVEQLDLLPDAAVDASTCVDELERKVRSAAPGPQPPLGRDRVDALDDAILAELGYGDGHEIRS